MVQFKLEDTMFFRQDSKGHFCQLPINALDEEILSADGATLKWIFRKLCVYQEHNEDEKFSPMRALGR